MLKRAGLLLNIIVAFSVVLALLPGQVQASTLGSGTAQGPQPPEGTKTPQSLSQTTDPAKSLFPPANNGGLEAALQRVDPELRQIAREGGDQLVKISVLVKPGADLSRYFEKLIVNPGKDFDRLTGMAKASNLVKLATASGTLAVLNMGARPAPDFKIGGELADGQVSAEIIRKNAAETKANLKAERVPLKTRQPLAKPQGDVQPQSFFTNDTNGVKQTWAEGILGDGAAEDQVKLAIVDTGVDFANPDLIGTAARIMDDDSQFFDATGGFGWPIAFDDRSMSDYALDNQDYRGNWGWYMNTNTEVNVWDPDITAFVTTTGAFQDPQLGSTAAFTFTVMHPDAGVLYEYIVDSPIQAWNTNGGWYRFGWHPDDTLAVNWVYETPGVLVTGEDTFGTDWGMFDTIYVDMYPTYWFDGSYPWNMWAALGNEVACVNLGWSAFPNCDLSGGMIYYISNGSTPVPASDWMYGLGNPAPGEVVAFMLNDVTENGGEHGTLCAGTAVGQGVIDMVPYSGTYGSMYWPPTWYDPDTMGISEGPGKNTGLVAMGNYYAGGSSLNFYDFAALGYDGHPAGEIDDAHDQPHMLSNSYGSGSVDNDGWDFSSRYQTLINYGYSAQQGITLPDGGMWSPLFFKSAGNSGFGYGTVNVPQPESAVVVGASGVYGQFNYGDTALYPEWVNWGQLTGMSDRGPSSMSTLGMHVLTNGMFGSGNYPLNYLTGGDWATDSWAGTSRSSPEAAGITALIFDAYYEKYGRYPSWQEARTLLMNGARTSYNDPFAQGAGLANAYGSYQVIEGDRPEIMTSEGNGYWLPGSYRDETYPSFARGLLPGESDTTELVIQNNDPYNYLYASLEAVTLEMYESRQWDFTSLPLALEGPSTRYYDRRLFGPAGSNTGFGGPDPVFIEGVDEELLAQADMMVVRLSYPFEQFENDVVGNWWFLYAYAWRDQPYQPGNTVGSWYKDGNDNHVRNSGEFDAPSETVRMIYDYHGNTAEIRIREPWDLLHGYTWPGEPDLAPMDDILLSLRHFYYGGYDTTDLKVTIELYKEVPWDQIEIEVPFLEVYPNAYEWVDITAVTSWKDEQILPVESFENEAPPTGWTVYDIDDGGPTWEPLDLSTYSIYYGDNLAHNGNEVYRHRSNEYNVERSQPTDVGMQEGWLVTPPLDLHDGSTLRFYDLNWWDYYYYYYFESENSVMISTGSCDPRDGEFEIIDSWWGYSDWWDEKIYNLSEYDGQTACIAFVYRGYEASEWWIDDVEIFSQTFDKPGEYTGYIKATYGAMPNEVVYMPVQKQVWFPNDIDPVLGGFEAGTLYENGVMFGGTGTADAQRAESGDWRFFYTDVDGYDLDYDKANHLLAHTTWQSTGTPPNATDIDTLFYEPVGDEFSWFDPNIFGPHGLQVAGGSLRSGSAPAWDYFTSTGGPDDWSSIEMNNDGLYAVAAQVVRWGGETNRVPYQINVGTAQTTDHVFMDGYTCETCSVPITFKTNHADLEGVAMEAVGYGWSEPVHESLEVVQDDFAYYYYDITSDSAYSLQINTWHPDENTDADLTVYYYDEDLGDYVVVGSSGASNSNEQVILTYPKAGEYVVEIYGYSIPNPDTYVDLMIYEISGLGAMTFENLPTSIELGTEYTIDVVFSNPPELGFWYGAIFLGPAGSPTAMMIPVLMNQGAATKTTEQTIVYENDYITYTIELTSGPASMDYLLWHLEDVIPANTSFVSVEGADYDPATDTISWYGYPGYEFLLREDFEGAFPGGWSLYKTGHASDPLWQQGMLGSLGSHGGAQMGDFFAWHNDDNMPGTADAVSWMVTPAIAVPAGGATLSFWERDYYQGNYTDHTVLVADASGGNPDPLVATYTPIHSGNTSEDWEQVKLGLSGYAGQTVYIAFRYTGDWDDEWYLDNVWVYFDTGTDTHTITLVVVTDEDIALTQVQNTAYLTTGPNTCPLAGPVLDIFWRYYMPWVHAVAP